MERCVWWVFIYPVAMHGPCGHVCASGTIYMTTSHNHPHINKAAPFNCPNHHPNNNNNAATLPAQLMNDNGWWATWPAQQTNSYNRQQATSPAQTQWPQTASHLTSPMDKQQQWMASHPTSPTDEWQQWTVTKLVNGCATMSRQWQHMSSSLSVNLSEHHDSPPCLLYSHENQGAMSPLVTWQLTLGLLLLTTLPTPGLCPMSPLQASACRAAMGPFI